MTTILRIDHVQIAMPPGQEEAAIRFYGDLLKMTVVPKPANLARRGGCWFESGATRLHLGVEADFSPARKAHPAFVVENLSKIRETLSSAGIECRDDEPLDGYLRTYISDPFGNRIELMQVLED